MNGNIKKTVRIGIVSAIYPEDGTARVTWPDEDNKVSAPLIVRQMFNAPNHKSYYMPDVDEQVICLFSENSSNNGVILGAIPSEVEPPLFNSADKCGLKFGPIEITLNRADGSINIKTSGEIRMKGSKVYINDPKD